MEKSVHRSYTAFSLRIDSEIPLDLPHFSNEDALTLAQPLKTVLISKAAIKTTFTAKASIDLFEFGTVGKDLVLHVFNVGRFLIHDFTEKESLDTIQVDADTFPDTKIYAIAHVIETILMAFLVHSDEGITLHGSSAVKEGRAVVIIGACGSGKSTTAAGLASRGWTPICDDLVPITVDKSLGRIIVSPGIPAPSLLPDSFKKFAKGSEAKEEVQQRPLKKRLHKLNQSLFYLPSPLAAIICLDSDSIPNPIISPITGYERLHILVQHQSSIQGLDFPQKQLSKLIALQNGIRLYSLTRPRDRDSLDEIVGIIDAMALTIEPSSR
jgi:hypothetical protein